MPTGKTVTLEAGAYRAVLVSSGQATQLELSGGLYELSSLELGQQARVLCLSTCELRIAGGVTLAEHAKLGPSAGVNPGEVRISVDGGGQQGVQVKPHAALVAHLVARNTGVTLGAHGIIRGRVIAVTVAIGPHAILNGLADAVEPVVDVADSTSEVKTPPPQPEGSTLPPPNPSELAAYVAKQQAFIALVKQRLQNEWKPLPPEEVDAARTELKETMLEVQP